MKFSPFALQNRYISSVMESRICKLVTIKIINAATVFTLALAFLQSEIIAFEVVFVGLPVELFVFPTKWQENSFGKMTG